MRRIVDFFVIGVQKGGTTAFDRSIRLHPSIQMATVKEVHFFDNDSLDWSAPRYDRLHAQFDWSIRDVQRGETTPIYIYWPQSLARLHRYNPEARLIVLLRHPGFRAFSQWRMQFPNPESFSFDEVVSDNGRIRVQQSKGGVHRAYSYVERGFYATQIERMFEFFPRKQVHFLRTDLLWLRPATALAAVADFLEVGHWADVPTAPEYIAPRASAAVDAIPAGTRAKLDVIFRADIQRTAELTGLDLLDWLEPDYSEPMQPIIDRKG